MQAKDVMVTDVVTVGPDLSVRAAASTLVQNRISAVPVVDSGGQLIGILSEGDLIRRAEAHTDRRRSGWLEVFTSADTLAAEFVKAHARKVSDVMTRYVITAKPETSLREIANLLEKHRVKRLPIVENGRIVGIVSRADLLRAVASAPAAQQGRDQAPGDEKLRNEILLRLRSQSWAHPSQVNVIVQDSTVDLWGYVESEAEHQAIRVLAEETPGVRAVNDYLGYNRVHSAL